MKGRWASASLGTRLASLYAGLLALLLAALGMFFHYETRTFLFASTAASLRAQAKPVIDRWVETSGGILDADRGAHQLARDLTSRASVALVYDARGRLLAHGRRLPEEPEPIEAPPASLRRALAGDNEVSLTADGVVPAMLMLLIPLRAAPGHPAVLGVAQLNTPLDAVSEVLLRQRVAITAGVLIAVVLGALAGLWLTKAMLTPLRRVIRACRDIAAGNLRQRLEPPRQGGEVAELSSTFNHMSARLEASFAARRRFIADAAHELRTPLAGLQASIEVLLRGLDHDPLASRQLLSNMYAESHRLGRLAEQLLDLSRMDEPIAPRRSLLRLSELMRRFQHRAQLLSRGHPVRCEPGNDVHVMADPDMLTQALVNLLDNALQHSAPGAEVRIGWLGDETHARVWVEDDGEGIAESDLPHILEPFYRGDRSRSRRRGGAGLGLSLVKRIAETHGGHLQVTSRLGLGSRFTLVLPLAGAQRTGQNERMSETPPAESALPPP